MDKMASINCSQCAYFKNDTAKEQCTRYSISMNRDNICVDCEEIDENSKNRSTAVYKSNTDYQFTRVKKHLIRNKVSVYK